MPSQSSSQNMSEVPRISIIGITGIPEVRPGDRLGEAIARASAGQGTPIEDGDILVVTQKIVSKAEGRLVQLSTVEPSPYAAQLAKESGRDPRLIELVLRESRAIVRMDLARGVLITETMHGFVCANAGIDTSNVPGDGVASLLPKDPDMSARQIREQVGGAASGYRVAVIISDTFGRAWREGHVNFAIGVAGMDPIKDYRGTHDSFGNVLRVTRIAEADELAGAAELVMAKATGIPGGHREGSFLLFGLGRLRAPHPRPLYRPVSIAVISKTLTPCVPLSLVKGEGEEKEAGGSPSGRVLKSLPVTFMVRQAHHEREVELPFSTSRSPLVRPDKSGLSRLCGRTLGRVVYRGIKTSRLPRNDCRDA